jgi:acyl-coenzyme A thioesterase PaaI-like protein
MHVWKAKWLMNLYPPLLINRISVKSISSDYKLVEVQVKKSLLNRNLQKTIFGGTIFSAADPFHALMYWQIFRLKGIHCEAWLKRAEIQYLKPANSDLRLLFEITNEEIELVNAQLQEKGKAEMIHETAILNNKKETVAFVRSTISLKKK